MKAEWSLLDEHTPIRFGVGLLAGMSNLNAGWALATVFSFEAAIIALESMSLSAPFKRVTPGTPGNLAVNVILGMYGVKIGEAIRRKQLNEPASIPAGVSGLEQQFPLAKTVNVLGIRRHVPRG
jgi:hypothetical protein